ncbi:MAG TPA: TetR/AcrR family transcriptional regulator [Mycobacteriales bacterium]|nr:TetR/AcrR family transcriptional regulator [Mycobacteriales bacterium]HWA65723.1 TetR/AcrR family transcriptional regulator [Mycobacteriales bacterium]
MGRRLSADGGDKLAVADRPRSRKGAQTRARLVEAAKAVFEADGFLEARITDIAEGAGVSHGSFYHYFDSKEQVFREVADALDDRMNAPLSDVILVESSHAGPRDRIREGNRQFFVSYQRDARLISEVEQVSRYDDQLKAERRTHLRAYGKQLAATIEEMQAAGLVDRALNPELTSHAIGAMVTRFADLWLTQGIVDTSLDEAVDQLTRLVCNALQLPDEPVARRARAAGGGAGS